METGPSNEGRIFTTDSRHAVSTHNRSAGDKRWVEWVLEASGNNTGNNNSTINPDTYFHQSQEQVKQEEEEEIYGSQMSSIIPVSSGSDPED